MCLCREVRFSAILWSCIGILYSGTGAFGTEAAVGLSACTWPTTCSFLCFPGDVPGGVLSVTSPGIWPQVNLPDDGAPAMAIPDGPGAVCFGIMGFVCVALVKNRRIWISLCLFAMSSGRVGIARLSKTSGPGPDHAGPDSLSEIGSECVLGRMSSCCSRGLSDPWSTTWLSVPNVLDLSPSIRPVSFGRLQDDLKLTGLLPFMGIVLDRYQAGRLAPTRAGVVKWPVCGTCIEWARPPPEWFPHLLG